VIKSRAVWKDLGSRRIGKSLEGVRVRDDVKGLWIPHGVHMVCTYTAEIKGMTSGHMYTAWWPYGKYMWMSNRHEVEAWWMDMR